MNTSSRITATLLASSFAFSLAACSTGVTSDESLDASSDAAQSSPEADALREEVIGVYLEELVASDDPVAAEEAIFSYYSDTEQQRREAQLAEYGDSVTEAGFAENHPGFSVAGVRWDYQDETTIALAWDAELECGAVEEHRTAFLIDVEETADGGQEVTRFSHASGCACATCVA